MRWSLPVALAWIALWPLRASACTCRSVDPWEALLVADVVAEIRLLDVGPSHPDDDLGVQFLRVRVERVFEGPLELDDGDELWIGYLRCNSNPMERAAVGERWVAFMRFAGGRLRWGYCSPYLSAWEPLPLPLIEARERRERRRR